MYLFCLQATKIKYPNEDWHIFSTFLLNIKIKMEIKNKY